MKILCVDTSTRNLSVAIGEDDKVVLYRNFKSNKRLSETFYQKMEAVLKAKNLRWKDLDGFIVGLGPGAFTSMRVGIASVQGLGFALKKPVVGVCSLDALAVSVGDHPSICVINDARRELLYTGYYTSKNDILKEKRIELAPIDDVLKQIREKTIFIGSGVALYRAQLEKCKFTETLIEQDAVQARYLLPLGFPSFKKTKKEKITPLYLYPEDCQVHR